MRNQPIMSVTKRRELIEQAESQVAAERKLDRQIKIIVAVAAMLVILLHIAGFGISDV